MEHIISKEHEVYEIYKNAGLSDEIATKVIKSSKSILRIRYQDPEFPTLHITENGNWIDLKCAEDYTIRQGESLKINLGVAMKLPAGCEAHLVPRSGTFDKYGLIQTNGTGIIDNSYSGTNDIWKMPVYATRDTVVHKGDRLCQFRLFKTMEEELFGNNLPNDWFSSFGASKLMILEMTTLDDVDRGGFGSTGL